jgi:hypothetical protein
MGVKKIVCSSKSYTRCNAAMIHNENILKAVSRKKILPPAFQTKQILAPSLSEKKLILDMIFLEQYFEKSDPDRKNVYHA